MVDRIVTLARDSECRAFLAVMGILCVTIKLSFALFFFLPLVLVYIFDPNTLELLRKSQLTKLLLFFVFVAALVSLFGLDPTRSLRHLVSTAYYAMIILAVSDVAAKCSPGPLIFALFAGQAIGATSGIVSALSPDIPRYLIGSVSESGQMAMTAVLGIALCSPGLRNKVGTSLREVLVAALTTCSLVLLYLSRSPEYAVLILNLAAIVLVLALSFTFYNLKRYHAADWYCPGIISVALPLILTGFIVNLKRGPWLGAIIGLLIFGALYSKRLVALTVISTALLIGSSSSIQNRLAASYDHFYIYGGRSVIWKVGAEMATLYPLGIGFSNSPQLRKFSTQIPPELKHFHNTPLNILAETGWLGLAVFAWWLIVVLKYSFSSPKDQFSAALGCAVLAWIIAGSVEYNFGDTEVIFFVFSIIGIIEAQRSRTPLSISAFEH